ncbi:hypothetical protein V6N11_064280 [Hibiscus sabdariffa]|uniref:Uncharacterized protein n=1 Tax=Hibiscus sabdariffa TaxID=183260 RepID=A0ABR2PNL8_9ROSI
MAEFAVDSGCWKGSVQGVFTVKSAYAIRWGPTVPKDGKLWKAIHKLQQLCLLVISSTGSSPFPFVRTGPVRSSFTSSWVQQLLSDGWFHANSDAGCRLADGSATCGGVIRNHEVSLPSSRNSYNYVAHSGAIFPRKVCLSLSHFQGYESISSCLSEVREWSFSMSHLIFTYPASIVSSGYANDIG